MHKQIGFRDQRRAADLNATRDAATSQSQASGRHYLLRLLSATDTLEKWPSMLMQTLRLVPNVLTYLCVQSNSMKWSNLRIP